MSAIVDFFRPPYLWSFAFGCCMAPYVTSGGRGWLTGAVVAVWLRAISR